MPTYYDGYDGYDSYEHSIKNFVPEKSDDEIKSNINDCEKYISELFRINDLSFEKIYSQTIIKKKDKYQGFFTFKCEKLETNLYQVHKHLTGNSPIAQNVLFCNKDTLFLINRLIAYYLLSQIKNNSKLYNILG